MKQLRLVFTYSFMERLRSKSFKAMTLILVFMIAALVFLPKLMGGTDEVEGEVAVYDSMGILDTAVLKQAVSPSYDWRVIGEADVAKEITRIENKEEGAALGVITVTEKDTHPYVNVAVNRSTDAPYLQALNSYVQSQYTLTEMNKIDLQPSEKARLTTAVELQVQELTSSEKSFTDVYLPIYTITFLLYLLIYMFGGNVATSVAVEKGSRVKEILITKVKPVHLLFGKVFGVGFAGILQFLIIIGAGYLMLRFSGSGEGLELLGFSIDFSILSGTTLLFLSIFFVLGYFFYAALFAAAGSLVSRSEEVNQAVMPMSIMIIAAMIVSLISMTNPEGDLAVIGSYVPFLTPFVMFVRIGMSDPTLLEILIPTFILAVSTVLAGFLSAKIYQVGVLLYGQKPTARNVYKALKSM